MAIGSGGWAGTPHPLSSLHHDALFTFAPVSLTPILISLPKKRTVSHAEFTVPPC